MFASAIWDPRQRTVVLARDSLGKKPLYWWQSGGSLLFASEMKALLAAGIPRVLDHEALLNYLVLDSVPTPNSMICGINKLHPGSVVTWSPGETPVSETFWPRANFRNLTTSYIEWSKEFESLLNQSVSRRLMADVPIGVLLSSGVDSSLVAALAQAASQNPLVAFTLQFESESFDESAKAQAIARALGLRHHRILATMEDLVSSVDTMTQVFDEPVNDPAILPMLLLGRDSRKTVKVVLTGDGGDELFYGYQHVPMHLLHERFPLASRLVATPISWLADAAPNSGDYFSASFKLNRLSRGLGVRDLFERDLAWRGAFRQKGALAIFNADVRASLVEGGLPNPTREIVQDSPVEGDPMELWSWWYLRTYLMDTVLVKVDRSLMAFGVEPRSPLLDQDLVSHVLRAPAQWKLGRGRGKALLRELASEHIPKGTMIKKKHGMGVPVQVLLRGPLRERLRHLSSRSHIRNQGLFDYIAVESLYRKFFEGRGDLRKEVWGFFVFQEWYSRWIDQTR
jgi:asparagine synthase (glutamine-hydrolysing)